VGPFARSKTTKLSTKALQERKVQGRGGNSLTRTLERILRRKKKDARERLRARAISNKSFAKSQPGKTPNSFSAGKRRRNNGVQISYETRGLQATYKREVKVQKRGDGSLHHGREGGSPKKEKKKPSKARTL